MKKITNTIATIMLLALTFSMNAQVTIYDIQFTEDASGDSPLMDEIATTTGIVTATDDSGYWIQDGDGEWNGLFIFDNTNTPSLGDEVTVTGEVQEFFNLTELGFISSFMVNSSGNALPNASAITTLEMNMESYEGVLISTVNAECTNADAGFGQWIIDDGSGAVFADDVMFNFSAVFGTFYNVTGIMSYSFDERKVLPRDAADIDIFVGIEEEALIELTVYPNPVVDVLRVNNLSGNDYTYTVYSLDGRLVLSGENSTTNTNNEIDFTSIQKGIYLVNILGENINFSSRIEKK